MDKNNFKNLGLEKSVERAFFSERLAFSLDLLNYKLSCLYNIDSSDEKRQLEYLAAFDSVITHLRAILLEGHGKNHTVQNYFIQIGKQNVAQKIDEYLNLPFDAQESQSIKKALKFISDKFVCHFDKITRVELGNANYIMSVLSSPYSFRNLNKIVDELTKIIKEE